MQLEITLDHWAGPKPTKGVPGKNSRAESKGGEGRTQRGLRLPRDRRVLRAAPPTLKGSLGCCLPRAWREVRNPRWGRHPWLLFLF